MATYQSWFRPWLDDPGPWAVWQLTPDEETAAAALLRAAAGSACARLRADYGRQANVFGGNDLVTQLASTACAGDRLFRIAQAVAAVDHYRARVTAPRPEPGGDTNPVNRVCWSRLHPFLMARLTQCLQTNAVQSLVCCAVSGRVADKWMPAAEMSRQLEHELVDSGLFSSVEVSLDLRLPVPGGRIWLAAETEKTVAAIRKSLARRQPVLVEILRDPATSPAAAQIVVVYRLEEPADNKALLTYYDPVLAAAPGSLRIAKTDHGFIFYDMPGQVERDSEAPESEDQAAAQGLHLLAVPPAPPPLFGARRWLRWCLPWGLCWYLKRRWLVWYHRKREQAVSGLPSGGPP